MQIYQTIFEINKVVNSDQDDYFYFLKDDLIDNKIIYFLAMESEIKNSIEKN